MFTAIRNNLAILVNPDKAFAKLHKIRLEAIVRDYVILLLLCGFLAGLFSLLYGLGNAVYLRTLLNVDIQFIRMLNYLLGRLVSMVFFYLFAGTFLFFILSMLLRIFFSIKYADLLKVLMYGMSPVLLFGWLPFSVIPLFIWALLLFIIGVRVHKHRIPITKNSIHQRD
ncbi:MAG: hypothetical protein V1725_03700 [archaeon]